MWDFSCHWEPVTWQVSSCLLPYFQEVWLSSGDTKRLLCCDDPGATQALGGHGVCWSETKHPTENFSGFSVYFSGFQSGTCSDTSVRLWTWFYHLCSTNRDDDDRSSCPISALCCPCQCTYRSEAPLFKQVFCFLPAPSGSWSLHMWSGSSWMLREFTTWQLICRPYTDSPWPTQTTPHCCSTVTPSWRTAPSWRSSLRSPLQQALFDLMRKVFVMRENVTAFCFFTLVVGGWSLKSLQLCLIVVLFSCTTDQWDWSPLWRWDRH